MKAKRHDISKITVSTYGTSVIAQLTSIGRAIANYSTTYRAGALKSTQLVLVSLGAFLLLRIDFRWYIMGWPEVLVRCEDI